MSQNTHSAPVKWWEHINVMNASSDHSFLFYLSFFLKNQEYFLFWFGSVVFPLIFSSFFFQIFLSCFERKHNSLILNLEISNQSRSQNHSHIDYGRLGMKWSRINARRSQRRWRSRPSSWRSWSATANTVLSRGLPRRGNTGGGEFRE